MDPDEQALEVHTLSRVTAFPVLDYQTGQFGRVEVTLEPGQRETVDIQGKRVTIIRDYLH